MLYTLPNNEQISHPALVAALVKPGDAILETLTPEKADAWHMASCIPGEVGELFTPVAANVFNGSPLDRENVIEELGDVEFYSQGLRAPLGINNAVLGVSGHIYRGIEASVLRLPEAAASVFDAAKKWVIYNKPLDLNAMVAALAGLHYLMEDIRDFYDITLDEVLATNVTKLGIRYASLSYSDTAAQVRADKVIH